MTDAGAEIDRLLACRGLREHTLGPTGARVFCAHLDNALGLRGRFCFRHDEPGRLLPDPIRLWVHVEGEPVTGRRASCMWYPSHALRQTKERGLGLVEHKFITWDDVICDVLELTNNAEAPLAVRLEAATGAAQEIARTGRDTLVGTSLLAGERVRMVFAMPTTKAAPHDRLVCELTLRPGEQTSLLVALAVGLRQGEPQAALKRWATDDDPLARHAGAYQRWFADMCPDFTCPDERLVRMWWYRWFLLRHNLVRQQAGAEELLAFHEARQGEQTRVRVAGAPLVLQEARWLRDGAFAHGHMRVLINGQSPRGRFDDVPSADSSPVKEWLPAALRGVLQVWPDRALLSGSAEASLRHLAALREECDPDHSLLLGGSRGPLALAEPPPAPPGLAEVDHTAMYAASLQAAAQMLAESGREVDARWHAGLAERCRSALLERMWDDWDHCFYSRDRATGEPLRVAEAGGFVPFAFGLVPDEPRYTRALALLVDEDHFWTEHPVAQVTRQAPANTPLPAAGLTLPYTNSLMAEAMAVALRSHKQRHIARRRLMDFLWLFARLQSEDDDPGRLVTREVYASESGEGFGARDCLQSSFNDLIIRHVVGLTPRDDDTLEVAPLAMGWDAFALRNVPYRGRLISVVYDRRADGQRPPGVPRGLSIYVDGQLVAESPELERLLVPL